MKKDKKEFKKAIKATTIALAVSMVGMTSVACYTTPETKTNINQIDPNYQEKIDIGDKRKYNEQSTNIQITPEEAAKGKTVENTKRTVNEYGNTIYGRKLNNNEPMYERLLKTVEEPEKYTYTEYYSDAYGGKVYIKTTNKSGGIVVYNENGKKFIAGDKPQNDLEVVLANYRMGNAMADAIKKTYK